MEVIDEDIQKIEEDVKKIDCNPICELIRHTLRCIADSFLYFWKK